ncbi:MAG: sugar transferase [Prevotellaceae bacterium]|nr:sugar transferase [Prevotellaceae bacterium]
MRKQTKVMNNTQKIIKRTFDIVVSLVCLLIFSPLFLYCYIVIRKEDGGPAIFSQERIGLHGKPFNIYKFRSMKLDAEKEGPALFNHDNDDRLTIAGQFLREHHLDELPQLWNVLKGDMSFIGPRPERKFYIDQIMQRNPKYELLYQIRPGVTSYATLYNGYTDTMAKMLRRLELDLYYLDHNSLLFDMKILWMTFTSIVFGKKF